VSAECGFELAADRRRQAALADHHDGFARMGEPAQVLLLFFGQIGLHA
jgi:hypothetical protein